MLGSAFLSRTKTQLALPVQIIKTPPFGKHYTRAAHMDEPYSTSQYPITFTFTSANFSIPLQRLHSLPCNILSHTDRLNPDLRGLLQGPHSPSMWVSSITGAELARSSSGPATLSILPTGIAASPGSKYGGFAGRKAGGGDVEYQAELSGRHAWVEVI